MSNFFSIRNGNLTDVGVFAKTVEIADATASRGGLWIPDQPIYSLLIPSDGSTITGLAINLSSSSVNQQGNLNLTYVDSLSNTFTEVYPISSFSKYGAASFNSTAPSNWQILKFTNSITPSVGNSYRFGFRTDFPNQLAIVSTVTAINSIDGNFVSMDGVVDYSNPFNNPNEISIYLSGGRNESIDIINDTATLYDISSGDFTVEGWFMFNLVGKGAMPLWYRGNLTTANQGILLQIDGNNQLCFYACPPAGGWNYVAQTTWSPAKDVFYHIAVTRKNDVIEVLVDGKREGMFILPKNQQFFNVNTHWRIGNREGTTTNAFNGKISNFRISKQGLYSTAFNTATAPLSVDSNTLYLVNGDGSPTDSSSILHSYSGDEFLNYWGDSQIGGGNTPSNLYVDILYNSFSPYTNNQGSSFKFTNTNSESYIAYTKPEYTGDFSVETWYYNPDSDTQSPNHRLFDYRLYRSDGGYGFTRPFIVDVYRHTNDSSKDMIIIWDQSKQVGSVGGWMAVTNVVLPRRTWHHIAIVKNGTGSENAKVYINGVMSFTWTYGATYLPGGCLIGRQWDNSGYRCGTYLSDFRVLTGVNTFQGVPTQPLKASDHPNTLALLSYTGDIKNKANLTTQLFGQATISTTEKKNNNGSIKLNLNEYARNALQMKQFDNRFAVGTSDFTVECWFKLVSQLPNKYSTIFDLRNSPDWQRNQLLVYIRSDRYIMAQNNAIVSQYPIPLNEWTHVAFVRKNGRLTLFINGKPDSYIQWPVSVDSKQMTFGKNYDSQQNPFLGYFDDVCYSKVAKYTDTFTPPSSPLVQTSSTSYLIKSGLYFNKGIITNITPALESYAYGVDDVHISGIINPDKTYTNTVITANNAGAKNIFVHKGGTLRFPTNASTTILLSGSDGLQITSEGTVTIGTSSQPIPQSVTHTVLLSNSYIDVHDGGNLMIYGDKKTAFAYLATDTRRFDKSFEIVGEIIPVIRWKKQPISNQKLYINQNASFTVSAYGDGDISYQWYRSDSGLISGATGTSYTLFSAVSTDDNVCFYSVACSTSAASITSVFGCLDVRVPSLSFVIPVLSGTTFVNRSATFNVSAVGDGSISYQWYRSDVGAIPSQNTQVYTIPNMSLSDNNVILYCVASSTFGLVVSSNTVSLSARVPQILIKSQPSDYTTYTGQSAQFTVSAEGDGYLSYQWVRSDTGIILGASSDTYTIPTVVSTQNRVYYYCDIKSTVGGATISDRALLIAPVPQLSFTIQPQNVTTYGGRSAFFSTSAVGDGTISYQWKRSDTGTIIGATSSSYLLNNVVVSRDNDINFYCIANSNLGVVVTSFPAKLAATTLQLAFLTQPATQPKTYVGGTNVFFASAGGTGTIALQWYRSDLGSISGATSESYSLSNAQLSDNQVNFYCVASSTLNLVVSSSFSRLSCRVPNIAFTVQPLTGVVGIVNFPVSYNVTVIGDGTISYVWNRSDTGNIPNSNSNTLTFNTQLSDDGVQFYCIASSNIAPSITSRMVTLSAKIPQLYFV